MKRLNAAYRGGVLAWYLLQLLMADPVLASFAGRGEGFLGIRHLRCCARCGAWGHGAFAIQEVQEPPESTLLACPLSFLSVTASHLLQADEACTIKDETIPENPILP